MYIYVYIIQMLRELHSVAAKKNIYKQNFFKYFECRKFCFHTNMSAFPGSNAEAILPPTPLFARSFSLACSGESFSIFKVLGRALYA